MFSNYLLQLLRNLCPSLPVRKVSQLKLLIKELLIKPPLPKLVVLNACESELIGEVFASAGVPHVIAVNKDKQIAGECSSVTDVIAAVGVCCCSE